MNFKFCLFLAYSYKYIKNLKFISNLKELNKFLFIKRIKYY